MNLPVASYLKKTRKRLEKYLPVLWHGRNLPKATSTTQLFWLLKHNLFREYANVYNEHIRRYDSYYRSSLSPMIVYAPMKVGSQTIRRSLEAMMQHPVLHRHFLFEENRNRWFDEAQELFQHDWHTTERYLVMKAKRLARIRYGRALIQNYSGKRWKVISLVREPIDRLCSLFFHFMGRFHHDWLCDDVQYLDTQRLLSVFEKLQESYLKNEMLVTWFGCELQRAFGINVFDKDFDTEKGYQFYTGPKADLLLLRLENLNECYQKAFQQFGGIRLPELFISNRSQDKGYDGIYSHFKQRVTFSAEYIDRVYELPYVRHFYSRDEIAHWKNRWTR